MSKEPRLKFTDKELAENTPVGTAARKAKKAAEKADKAQAKIPKRKQPKVELRFEDDAIEKTVSSKGRERSVPEKQKALKRAVQEPLGKKSAPKSKSRSVLRFEEQEKKPPKHPNAYARDAPRNAVRQVIQENAQEQDENENVGVEAAQTAEEIEHRAEGVLHEVHYSAEMRPYRGAQKAEEKLEKANLDYLQKKAQAEHPTSNPVSRWRQKQEIKRQYAAAKAGKSTTRNTAEAVSSGVSSAVETVKEIGKKLFSNKKLWTAVLGIFFLLSFLLNVMSSCSVIIEGVGSVLAGSTYPASDNALLGAEAMYKGKEDDLRGYLNSYESSHDYDEYHFDLDEITHDPYVLSSLLSALDPNSLSLGAVAELIDRIFDQQYILTENVVTETRYKTETKTRNEYTYNAESGSYEWHSYTYTEQVPYDYTICTVTLENRDLSHLPVEILTTSQLNMYATYMATLGNRPDLFPGSPYVELYLNKTDQSFDFPPDALSDDRVAAMLKEAQKYLGYPYVWGGSSPSTSFDCSGYVCWVVNHSGWNIGRLSAQGICNICTPISASILKPGDLVFFKGTYDTPGVSHCGIYVGNGTMIHCGDPIKYANINTTYWQSHFYMFGRLP